MHKVVPDVALQVHLITLITFGGLFIGEDMYYRGEI